jgi:hypothetical protein
VITDLLTQEAGGEIGLADTEGSGEGDRLTDEWARGKFAHPSEVCAVDIRLAHLYRLILISIDDTDHARVIGPEAIKVRISVAVRELELFEAVNYLSETERTSDTVAGATHHRDDRVGVGVEVPLTVAEPAVRVSESVAGH